jgi:hypothetical protein
MENNDMKIPTLDSLSRPERQFADAQSIAIGILLIMRHQVAMYGKCFSGPQTRGLTPLIIRNAKPQMGGDAEPGTSRLKVVYLCISVYIFLIVMHA